MKERILFVCVGQGGGNIGQLFENKGYNCLFINTSYDDLKTIDAKHKFHIAGTFGCHKDRKKALAYVKQSYKIIVDVIESRFPQQDLVYFIFSSGGGTGSGLSPILLDLLSSQNLNKHYSAITILPSLNESIKAQMNAVETYRHLIGIENLKNLMILDNNNLENKFIINELFAEMFDMLMDITVPDTRNVIDISEIGMLFESKGNMYMAVTKAEEDTDLAEDIINVSSNNVFTQFETGSCQFIAVSLAKRANIDGLEDLFGIPVDTMVGYNNSGKYNFTAVTGLPYPRARIEELIKNIEIKHRKMKSEVNDDINDFFSNLEIPSISFERDYSVSIPEIDKIREEVVGAKEKTEKKEKKDLFDIVLNGGKGIEAEEKKEKKKKIVDIDELFEKYS